jgi:hypothetical protein
VATFTALVAAPLFADEAAAPLAPAADLNAVAAIADCAPSGEEVARLCVAHGRYCDCPGCRAYYNACGIPCPPGIAPEILPETMGQTLEGEAAEPQTPATQPPPMSGPMTSVSSNYATIASASSASPGMIGDFFGGGYMYNLDSAFRGSVVAIAGGDRILKFADNNSPLPQDRLFFNYHLFANPVYDVRGQAQDVNRFTFGLEKTFWGGTASLEFRVPFAAGVDSSQTIDQTTSTLAAEFGNLALATKLLLFERGPWAIAGGLGMIFPTANDATIFVDQGDSSPDIVPAARFANESFFLQPFGGVYYRPTPRFFSQFIVQANFDVTGSTFTLFDTPAIAGSGSQRLYEQSLLFLDLSTGYWIYQTKRCDTWLTGIAPMVELHYTTTMQPLDLPAFSSPNEPIFEEDLRRDALNITGGVLFGLGRWTSLRVAGVAPLRRETLMYDAEFGVQLIRRY